MENRTPLQHVYDGIKRRMEATTNDDKNQAYFNALVIIKIGMLDEKQFAENCFVAGADYANNNDPSNLNPPDFEQYYKQFEKQ